MKKAVIFGAMGVIAASASAQSVLFDANVAPFGDDDPNGNGTGDPALVYSNTFALPAIDSIDSAAFELSHSYMSDIHLTLTSPGGDVFFFAKGRSGDGLPPFDSPFDGAPLGDGGSSLDGVEWYTFAEAGDAWNDGDGGTVPAPGGTFAAVEWIGGGFGAGDWTVEVYDAWDTIDAGALGSIEIAYTVPAPGALALLGLGGMAAIRRRR